MVVLISIVECVECLNDHNEYCKNVTQYEKRKVLSLNQSFFNMIKFFKTKNIVFRFKVLPYFQNFIIQMMTSGGDLRILSKFCFILLGLCFEIYLGVQDFQLLVLDWYFGSYHRCFYRSSMGPAEISRRRRKRKQIFRRRSRKQSTLKIDGN